MSEIVVTVKLPEGVDADDIEVTVGPMPAQTEESAVYLDWQPIETAPKDGTHILLARFVPGDTRDCMRAVDRFRTVAEAGYEGFGSFNMRFWPPTHWMPLQPAPAEARSEQPPLDQAWAAVNVLGAPDSACTTPEDRAYCAAINDALAEIEKLGGQPS